MARQSLDRRTGSRRVGLAAVVAMVVLATACTTPRPSGASLAAEPVLQPLPGEVELAEVRVQPRAARIGVAGRDGVVERVVAVELDPTAAADLVQERHGGRYRFGRVDLGGGTPVTVELRGSSPTGAQVIVTSSTAPPVPLYGGLDEVRPMPPDLVTTVVITVVSPQ